MKTNRKNSKRRKFVCDKCKEKNQLNIINSIDIRKRKGRNVRTNTQDLINQGLLTCEPDGNWQMKCSTCGKLNRSKWRNNVLRCPKCHPQKQSAGHYWKDEMNDYISEYNAELDQTKRETMIPPLGKFDTALGVTTMGC